eukprot:Hpha_TRINITY_DN13600_c0_g1::TRINITY_DN13600_c0_g1_i1::g.122485::m.122485
MAGITIAVGPHPLVVPQPMVVCNVPQGPGMFSGPFGAATAYHPGMLCLPSAVPVMPVQQPQHNDDINTPLVVKARLAPSAVSEMGAEYTPSVLSTHDHKRESHRTPEDMLPKHPPCSHNHWEKLRTRKGCNILRCFECLCKWKFNKFSSKYATCKSFSLGDCPKGAQSCALLHIERSRPKTRADEGGAE